LKELFMRKPSAATSEVRVLRILPTAAIHPIAMCLLFQAAASVAVAADTSEHPLLLRQPAISATQIVFNYAGDLWIVPREGGDARRITTAVGEELNPAFSPDGSTIAFTGAYDGNQDVFVVQASGGEPKRLTYHPAWETVNGWTPDGESVLFHSNAESYYHYADELYTVSAGGGFPAKLPIPTGFQATYSPDGRRIAYVPHGLWEDAWKRYRGGQTTPIWILDLATSEVVDRIPRENSNDSNPMWVGDVIYFLSDRNGPVTLFAYDTGTKEVREIVKNDGLDLKSASATRDAIVYEQFGSLHVYEMASGRERPISVRVSGDFSEVRPRFIPVDPKALRNVSLSPSGKRALAETWGEIFTIPTDKGDIRNITRSPGVAERDPAWSPDGKSIACFSDVSGEYALEIRGQSGIGEAKRIGLGDPPSFFYSPTWSPDSKKIAYFDKRLNLWAVDVEKGQPFKVDTDLFEAAFQQTWSPDSKWIAYVKQLPNHLHAVFVYSFEQKNPMQITDGMSDALFPWFDKNGKYLYFTASTDVGLSASGLDMSSDAHPLTRSVYVVVLSKDLPSPLAPESDEEKPDSSAAGAGSDKGDKHDPDKGKEKGKDKHDAKAAEGKDANAKNESVAVKIDFEGIGQRILALPIPARNYWNMIPGKSGVLFLSEGPLVFTEHDGEGEGGIPLTIQKFDLEKRKIDKFIEGVNDFTVSMNGEKLLYRKDDQWIAAGTDSPPGGDADSGDPKPGEGPLKLSEMQVQIDPRAAWKQIYHEVWRIERDFLYDPNHHGLDLNKIEAKYQPYISGIASRGGLTYLLTEALGEISIGHMFVGGGEEPQPEGVKGGLLGADYSLENGRYRVARVYDGENWNPGLEAPLTQPGVNVKVGEYILAVGGRDMRSIDNIYEFFENTAGTQVRMTVGPNPDGKGSRDVTVVPVASEEKLRRFAWIEGNRRKVDEMTGGKVAYVYLPNTGGGGYTNFNRYYFAQVGKEAAIIDERFNEGGQIADYIINNLRQPIMSRVAPREGLDSNSPTQAIYGPKVMIINEMAGSGGDAMPWYFRKAGIGPLVGKRTWGGLVGIGGYPVLMDGGFVTAPSFGLYGLNGEWEVENHGIGPDFDVDLDPKLVREGHDPQLEKAVEVVLDLLRKNPTPTYPRPPYPNYHQSDGLGVK
jgi:tricorn protease